MLNQQTKNAVLWSGVDIFLRQGLQFGISVALARILSPDEFGTIALLLLFTGVASVFVDGGFSLALIQRQDVSHTDESTVFWLNLVIGSAMMIALWITASAIARFYLRPVLEPLIWIMAVNIFLGSLSSIHSTLLTKRLDFKIQMKIGFVSTLVSGCIAVAMALQGFGIWALAMQTLVATTVTGIMLWVLSSWRPMWTFSGSSARRLFGFGGYLMGSALLDIFYTRLYTLLIGRFYGVRELGFYERADSTMHLPAGLLSGIISRVAFPIFSATSSNKEQLRKGVQLSVRVMMLINVPLMLGLAAVAESLVEALFGAKWLPIVPVMQVLCLGGVFWPLHVINLNVLMAQGHTHLFFRLELIKKIIGLALLISGAFYGIMGIAWSQVIFGFFAFCVNAHYTKRYLEYGMTEQVLDFFPSIIVATITSGAVYWLGLNWQPTVGIRLLGLILFGMTFFTSVVYFLKLTAAQDIIKLYKTS